MSYNDFLLQTVNEIDRLILDPGVRALFQDQWDILYRMVEQYREALEQQQKRAESNHQLKDPKAGPPEKGMVWKKYYNNAYISADVGSVFWMWPEPPNPLLWFDFHGSRNIQRPPTDADKLMVEYALLAAIHDESLTSSTDKKVYLDKPYNGKWFERDKFSEALWRRYYYPKNDQDAKEKKAKIERALQHVKADLKERCQSVIRGQEEPTAKNTTEIARAQEHKDFLFGKATDVDRLITYDENKKRFHSYTKEFCGKVAAYEAELESYKKAAQADPRLLDYNHNSPPKEGYKWHGNFWAPPTKACNPLDWFPPHSYLLWPDWDSEQARMTKRPSRLPNDHEKLMCHYVLLGIIHDGALSGPLYERVYFAQSYETVWTFRDSWGRALWTWLSDLSVYKHRKKEGEKIRALVDKALERVKADLAKPHEVRLMEKRALAFEGWAGRSEGLSRNYSGVFAGYSMDIHKIVGYVQRNEPQMAKPLQDDWDAVQSLASEIDQLTANGSEQDLEKARKRVGSLRHHVYRLVETLNDTAKDLVSKKSKETERRDKHRTPERMSKAQKLVAITAVLQNRPNATSGEVENTTGIHASDVRRLWGPIKKAMREGRRPKRVGYKNRGHTDAVDESTSCKICNMPLAQSFECRTCNDIIVGECKTCHYTNTHPDDAEP
jgi:hypothetical protein